MFLIQQKGIKGEMIIVSVDCFPLPPLPLIPPKLLYLKKFKSLVNNTITPTEAKESSQ